MLVTCWTEQVWVMPSWCIDYGPEEFGGLKSRASVRLKKALAVCGVNSWERLYEMGQDDIMAIRGAGATTRKELIRLLDELGMAPMPPGRLWSKKIPEWANRAAVHTSRCLYL